MSHPVSYIHLVPEGTLPAPALPAPSKVVVIADAAVSPQWQSEVSDWLVSSGCLYMMAWGVECSSWDDSVDMANLEAFDFGPIPDENFLITTWHTDAVLDEVFEYCKYDAEHPTVEFKHTVLLHIAADENRDALLQAYAAA